MNLSRKKFFLKRVTRITAGAFGICYGLFYFFPDVLEEQQKSIRLFLIALICIVVAVGWLLEFIWIQQDKKRKRDSLPMN
jgi:hypothetical protein